MFNIYKLGGTTIGNYKYYKNILKISKNNPLFVVSAINTNTKAEGTTTQLLNIYNEWDNYKNYNYNNILYEMPFKNLISSHEYLENKLDIPNNSKYILKENFYKWKQNSNINNFVSLGELMSAHILHNFFKKNNISSTIVDLQDILIDTDINLSNSKYRKNVIDIMKERLDYKYNGIPIMTGFMGIGGKGTFDTLGRGYSDTTSSIIASSYDSPLNVMKDSGGVFTGHPFKIKKSSQIDTISLDEAIELTSFGNEVLHEYTSYFAKDYMFDISIKDIRDLNNNGTLITSNINISNDITAISVKENINIISIKINNNIDINNIMNDINKYKPLLISKTNHNISFATTNIITNQFNIYGSVTIYNNRVCISCIGEGMKYKPGTSTKIFKTFSDLGLNIEMITQGPNEINISVIVKNSKDIWNKIEYIHDILI